MAQRVVIPGFRKIEVSGGGEGGTSNYNDLTNKPSINNVPLVGNLNTVDLKLTDATLTEEGVPAEAKTVGAKLAEQSSNLTSEISRAKETEETLKSRIDNIASLPEGSTTGDAELQDIRVKADGTTATSAGNAVREQFSELKGDLVNQENMIRNGNFDINIYWTKPSGQLYIKSNRFKKLDKKLDIGVDNPAGWKYTVRIYDENGELLHTQTDVNWECNYDTSSIMQYEIDLYRYDGSNCPLSDAKHFYAKSYYDNNNSSLLSNIVSTNLRVDGVDGKVNLCFSTDVTGNIPLNELVEWRTGEYWSDGTYDSNIKYRICNRNPLSYPIDITVTTSNPNAWYLNVLFREKGTSKWTYKECTQYLQFIKIPKDYEFNIVVRRLGEDTSEIADIELFASNVRIITQMNKESFTPAPYNTDIIPPYWILHLDCARKFISVNNIKSIIDTIAANGLNQLQLHFSEDSGFRFALDDMLFMTDSKTYDLSSALGGEENANAYYSQSDMDSIVNYAMSKGIDIVPSFDMPGHIGRILNVFPSLGSGALDINNEESIRFAKIVVDRYSKYFSSRGCHYWNIGLDETVKGVNAIKFANMLVGILKDNGLTPRIWNDSILYNNDYNCLVNKDTEIIVWATNNGYALSSTMQKVGYKLINGSERFYYVLNHEYPNGVTVDTFKSLALLTTMRDEQLDKNVYGCQLSVWCDYASTDSDANDNGNNLVTQITPLIVAFGNAIKGYII